MPTRASSGSTSCWCAPQSHVGQTSLAACRDRLRSDDGQEHIEAEQEHIEADWVARLEKLEQMLSKWL